MNDSHRNDGPRRVLFLSYMFPPGGGAGVQRPVKFAKYLPGCGWKVSVITALNPSVPVIDESLHRDVPEETLVRRVKTWEPGYRVKSALSAGGESAAESRPLRRLVRRGLRGLVNLALQPDPQILFVPNAVRAGRRLLREVRHDVIVATAPPFSMFLAGRALSRQFGIPLILDYRDEWDSTNAHSENRRVPAIAARLQRRMQLRALRAASAVLATTRQSAAALESLRDAAGSSARVLTIYNGYDPDDLRPEAAPSAERDDSVYRLSYVGTLWNLTDVEPLVRAVRKLCAEHPDKASSLELVFAGRRTAEQAAVLARLRGLPCRLVERPYVNHAEAVELMRSSDGLLLLLADVPEARRCVPAKLFEYMAVRRPVLAIAPPGEAWDLLKGHPSACLRPPGDTEGIARGLLAAVDRRRSGVSPDVGEWDASDYSRPRQAMQLAEIMEDLAGTRAERRSIA